MSVDDILAANLWPWPDPLLKRDRLGSIIFVNAAFLSLYGGRVEDWCGRPLNGWPEPNLQGAQRFETRTGEGESLAIYDWVETVMADGNTMAIARNVTALIAHAQQSAPQQSQSAPKHVIPANVESALPRLDPARLDPARLEETLANEPGDDNSDITPSTPQSSQPIIDAPASATPETLQTTQITEQVQHSEPVQAEQVVAPEAHTPPPPLEIPEEPRMIARRALPIKDSESVLGNNWRDQVIAKAIGNDAVKSVSVEEGAPLITEQTVDETPIPENPSTPNTQNDGRVGAGLNILLAEDNAINALLTRTLLEADGATVETVEDGSLAVEAVKTGAYDLIFMDMRMPKMDGLEATRKIRGLGKTMPIVALTANAFDDDRNACFDSGMNDFMTKPVSAEELTEMVSTWVKNVAENQTRLAG
ncbi:MAG: hypothetical protein COA43_04185 [Robiginitomaculum sp.]|nr:MAG: hypothetical protein COA43_04185 [Robiginitomaculum sp.]